MTVGQPFLRQAAGKWAEDARCRVEVHRLMRSGWTYQRAQHHVTGLFYQPGDGGKPGMPPKEPREDPWFLARLLCADCPVVAECREHAVATHDDQGFRAGLQPTQLKRQIKERRRNIAQLVLDWERSDG